MWAWVNKLRKAFTPPPDYTFGRLIAENHERLHGHTMTTQKLHAMLSPSGGKKWMTCSGSVALEADLPDDTSEYADEGTAAHELARRCLKRNEHPAQYLKTVLTIINGVYWPGDPEPKPAKLKGQTTDIVRTFEVTIDMVAHVNTYVQRVKEYAALGTLQVEQKLPIGHITGEDGATGTGDAIVLIEDDLVGDPEIGVHDLKYGMGVQVFAAGNPQMMLYALGAVKMWQDANPGKDLPFKRARMVIHQPRLSHLDEWDCSIEELFEFAKLATERARRAMHSYESRGKWLKESDHLKPGDHCSSTFCKARPTCPALAKYVEQSVGADFELLTALPPLDVPPLVPTGPAVLAEKFKAIDIIMDWCKAVRAKAEAMLFEHGNSDEITKLLGIKLVEGKKGNRQWADEAKAEAILKKMRFKVEQIYDMKLISPTAACDKLLKDQPKRLAQIVPLVTRKDGVPSVAPLQDKRPALVITPPADDFDVIDEPRVPVSVDDLV